MEPKELVRRFIEEYQDKRDPDALAEYMSPNVVDHTPMPGTAAGQFCCTGGQTGLFRQGQASRAGRRFAMAT